MFVLFSYYTKSVIVLIIFFKLGESDAVIVKMDR